MTRVGQFQFSWAGLSHLGEIFDKILSTRQPDRGKPIIVRDQSSSNKIIACETVSAGCLQHAREYFCKAAKNYPDECEKIQLDLARIFEIDRSTHDLSARERLDRLKNEGLPLMEGLLRAVQKYMDEKIATPASDMGIALSYFKKHYPTLLVPFNTAGVGLTNNLSEWMTYPVVRYINNCRHYATEAGAAIGDYVMSFTMMALLSGRNPIKYIEYLLANQGNIEKGCQVETLPWEISVEQVPKISEKWFDHWIPKPDQTHLPHEAV